MTCACGAKMCYICKAKIVNYDHFYGQVKLKIDNVPMFIINGSAGR